MTTQLENTILAFTQSEPRTIAEVVEHLYIPHPEFAEYEMVRLTLRRMILSGVLKNAPKRKVRGAWLNQYLAMTEEDKAELEESKRKVTTPEPVIMGCHIMAAFYGKQNL